VLFDEIEKAHPRILDKFLQLLDDGVLTSGRGERVYFSEAVIIFTSNLGIYRTSADGMRELNVEPGEAFIDVERKVRAEIERYFKQQLNRPELLNRIGENIVVFDFIRPQVAGEIYEKMARGVLRRLAERRKIHVSLLTEVDSEMRERCTQDLSNGGRGIGNQLEAWLINPLARALFDSGVSEGSRLEMVSTEEIDGAPTVRLRPEAATGR
jgi:ATP-dependent Clp protease ATP-binding subunit ClpA